jgi:hypothetical protein
VLGRGAGGNQVRLQRSSVSTSLGALANIGADIGLRAE